ncbi:MAG: hydrogenase iron-sulfur subunit [Chlorobiaceae bacterium]|nr:hydrogenase iron-sulfur subunit [Chlorobiaceae bacterium]NTW74205.1 hydrogenase iron-sulfur subunit [Chlorobiaceae bacterium]
MTETFEPKIVAFVCTYCTYAGADLAGTSRMKYASNVRMVRLPCTGRISPMFILKALQKGADGVLVSGCHPGDCHFAQGNYHARRRWTVFRSLLAFTGIPEERIKFSWISAAEGAKFAELINSITDEIRALGPFEQYQELQKVIETQSTY